jgi:transposase
MLHRTRQLFVRQRTTLINAIRAHLAEFGIVAPIGATVWRSCCRPLVMPKMTEFPRSLEPA